jgi:hypothetical protein
VHAPFSSKRGRDFDDSDSHVVRYNLKPRGTSPQGRKQRLVHAFHDEKHGLKRLVIHKAVHGNQEITSQLAHHIHLTLKPKHVIDDVALIDWYQMPTVTC